MSKTWTADQTGSQVSNRLSYSQLRLYSECGMKYKYHYIDKYRERTKSGALVFGTAFDKAIEAVLKNPNIDEKAVFDGIWSRQEINGKEVYIPDSVLVGYAASDFDNDLLTDEDRCFLKVKAEELLPELFKETGSIEALYEKCKTFKSQKAFRHFKEEELKFLNLCNWCSLRRKGHLMLDANRTQILPRIKKVIGTQVKVNLKNEEGDSLLGFVDLVCEWDDGNQVIFDYKTSSIEYDADSVLTSPQLTIYSHSLNIKRAGYLVFRKGIIKNKVKICSVCGFDGSSTRHKTCNNETNGKRCGGTYNESINPEVDVNIIINDIPERTEDIVLENIDAINKAIKAGVFVRNFGACKQGYGNCPFMSACFKNDFSDLEKV